MRKDKKVPDAGAGKCERTETEMKFQTIFELADDIMVYFDKQGKIVDVNRRVEDVLGYTPEEIKGRNFTKLNFLDLKDARRMLKLFSSTVKSGVVDRRISEDHRVTRLEVRHKDGRKVLVEASTTGIREGGELKGFVSIVRDLTERRRTEAALRRTRKRYQDLFNNSPIGIYSTTPDGRILMANPVLVGMLGYASFEELVSRNLEKEGFEPSYPRDKFKEIMDAKGEVVGLEAAWMRKDGSIIFVRENAKAVRDKSGAILYYEGTVEDVTKRRLAEEALQQSEERFRTLFESTREALVTSDPHGRIVSANPAAAKMLGYDSSDDLVGKHALELYADTERRKLVLKGLAERDYVEDLEIVGRRKDGSHAYALASFTVQRDDQGNVLRTHGIFRDITERKQAEQALRESEEKFSKAFHATSNLIGISTIEDGRIVDINEACCRLIGYKREELIGRTTDEFNIWADPEQRKTVTTKLQEGGQVRDLEVKVRSKSGDVRTVLFSADIITLNDESCLINTAIDITERKQAEEALKESENRYRSFVQNFMGIAFRGGINFEVDFFHGFVEEITGYTEEDFVKGRIKWQELIHRDDLPRVLQEIKQLTRQQRDSAYREYRIVRKTGETAWVQENIQVLFADSGEVTGCQGTIYDITERRRAEDALRKSEEKYRALFEGSLSPITIYDRDANIVMLNKAGAENLKKPLQEIVGKPLAEFIPQTYELTVKRVRQVLQTGKPLFVEDEISLPDGKRWFLSTLHPLSDSRGQPNLVQVISYEISERKQAEQELVESEELFSKAFRTSPNLMVISTLEEGRIVDVNEAFCNATGYDHEETIGRTTLELDVWADSEQRIAIMRKVQDEGCVRDIEAALRTKAGDIRILLFSAEAITLHDERCLITVAVDITERKRAEEALKHSETLHRTLFKSATDAIFLMEDYRFVECNEATLAVYGCSKHSDIIGQFPWVFSPTRQPDGSLSQRRAIELMEAALGGRSQRFEWTHTHLDGSEFQAEVALNRLELGDRKMLLAVVRDITERKQAEEALRESEKKFRLVTETIGDVFWMSTPGIGRMIYVSPAYEKIWGRTRESLYKSPQSFVEAIHPDDRNRVKSGVAEHAHGKWGFEYRILRPDGSVRWIQDRGFPILDESENLYLMTGVASDITERKQAEEALHISEARYRSLFNSMRSGVAVYAAVDEGEDFIFTDFNDGGEKIERMTKEEVIGRKVSEVFPGVKKMGLFEVFQRVWRTGKPEHLSASYYQDDRVQHWVQNEVYKLPTGEIVAIYDDVTERKHSEEALRESERKYRDLVENINQVIYSTDEKGMITYMSPAIEGIGGYQPSEIVGRNYLEFIHPEDKPAIAAGFERVKKGEVYPSEYRITPKDGPEVWIRMYSRPVFEEGRFAGIRGVMTDITERKRLLQQLIQSEKSAAVGTLAYGIAHEFNNILAGIMVNAEYGLSTADIQQIRECFNVIVESSQRGASITNSLLAVAGEKRRKKELVDVIQPLENVLSFCRRELEKADIRVTENLKPVPEIFCDPGEFSEIFLNMINNARDAMMPKGGTLTVKVASHKDNIRIVFRDTGVGIPDEIKDKIFDPFVTTKGALGQSNQPGTGLGLHLTYGIVDNYGGKIEVESEVGKGTTFTILIPVSKNLPSGRSLETEISPPHEVRKELNILVIDDEKAICNVLSKFLKSKGHKVTAAMEAKEGLRQFKKSRFDLILSDITMPGMDGIELIREMKHSGRDSRIIAITGHVRKDKLEQAKDAGADEVLVKPFKNVELYGTIARLYQDNPTDEKRKETGD